jgi:hypothetical protein
MGVETEYAFAALAPDGSPLDREPILTRLEKIAAHQLPHLPAMQSRGIFLANGARFYRDFGGNDAHQELATPECANPWDVVRYIRAGERMLSQLAAELLRADRTIAEALYFRTNVDYGGAATTWGCHESYLTRTDIRSLSRPLIPHLVSRIIYTGAGGFNARSPGVEFMLSPRVAHLCEVVSPFSESSRPIFHLKDESLSRHKCYHRLHVICGESLCSEMAIWLKVAATALIVAMADAGLDVAAGVELVAPLEAMRQFARDPTCQAEAKSADGRPLSALAIQRHYLRHAEAHSGDDFMPPWAGLACQQWRAILERLEQEAPDSVATTLDWAIKLALFKDRVPTEDAEAVCRLRAAVAILLGKQNCTSCLRRRPIRHRHFHRLGSGRRSSSPRPGVENIEHAMDNPAAVGRARVRGELVKRFVGCNGRYTCDWHGLWDLRAKQFLDLSDPFGTTQKWGPMPAEQETQHLDFQARMRERSQALGGCPANRDLDKVMALYEQGCFEKAFRLLQSVEPHLPGLTAGQRESYWRQKAWVQCRRGFLDARDCLQEIGRNRPPTMSDIVDYLYVLRFQGLAPAAEMNDWIRCGLDSAQRLESNPLPPGFHEHRGNLLLYTGQVAEAEGVLESAVAGYRPAK